MGISADCQSRRKECEENKIGHGKHLWPIIRADGVKRVALLTYHDQPPSNESILTVASAERHVQMDHHH